ncbi:hypothetical protein IWX90DRAFT_432291 [Phyllosticta citrichinensis]|uniref:Transmembrane protein n=1 Tax=Phyllosticta citrichinensis TaxID=1130410 RepID=A0ABR1XSK5_9PEZI
MARHGHGVHIIAFPAFVVRSSSPSFIIIIIIIIIIIHGVCPSHFCFCVSLLLLLLLPMLPPTKTIKEEEVGTKQ